MYNIKVLTVVLLITVWIPNSLQNIAIAECQFKISPGWKVIGLPSDEDPYGCFLTKLFVKTKADVKFVTGKHLYGNTNVNVKALSIQGGICEIIPSGIDQFYPNIEAFSVWNATLKTVSSADLQQFPNLLEIWLYLNLLEFLPSNLFEYNPKIQYISFNSNKIKSIGEDFFNYLPSLQRAVFWYNICINDGAGDATKLEIMKENIKQKCSQCEGETQPCTGTTGTSRTTRGIAGRKT